MLASDIDLLHCCIHVELHLLCDAFCVVNDRVRPDRHLTTVFEPDIFHPLLLINYMLSLNVFQHVVDVQHEKHLTLCESFLYELVWRELNSVLEEIHERVSNVLDEFLIRHVLDVHVEIVLLEVLHE